jgi:hypothetical protein
METSRRAATPDELAKLDWRPPEQQGCVGRVLSVVFLLGFTLFCASATWAFGSMAVEAAMAGDLGKAVAGLGFTAIGVAIVAAGGMALSVSFESEGAAPTVTSWTIRPTSVGCALDDDDRAVWWCFATTESGTFVIPSTALPWEDDELLPRLAHAELRGEVLFGLLSFASSGGPVPRVGPTDLEADDVPTWTDGDLDIDLEGPLWTRVDPAPGWLRP